MNLLIQRFIPGMPRCFPAEAVDAEEEVENGSHERAEPDETNPADGRAHVALVEHNMRRGGGADQQIGHGNQVRPELSQQVDQFRLPFDGGLSRPGTMYALPRGQREG